MKICCSRMELARNDISISEDHSKYEALEWDGCVFCPWCGRHISQWSKEPQKERARRIIEAIEKTASEQRRIGATWSTFSSVRKVEMIERLQRELELIIAAELQAV